MLQAWTAVYYTSALPMLPTRGAYSLFSDLSRLGFTLTEPDDSLQVDLVDHVENDLESPFVVFMLLTIFLEGNNDFGLMLVISL